MDSPFKTLEVRRVTFSYDIEKPGDFCFIGKRESIRAFEPVTPIVPPQGFFARLFALFFPKKAEVKEIVEIVWPDYDATVPFEVQNRSNIEKLIQCESQGVNISRPDSNGRLSDGRPVQPRQGQHDRIGYVGTSKNRAVSSDLR